jgi:diguanylate cyclase (GGDEF)-like protein
MTTGLDPQDVRTALGALGAIQDDVTRLPNRRAFRMIGQQLLDVSARHNHELTLFLLRINNLEAIEASPDRRASRWVLVAIAEVLRSTFRESDLVARLRDDEFAVLATATGDPDRALVEGRLAEELGAAPALQERPVALELSVGAAPYARGATLNELIDQAATALRALSGSGE